MLDVIISVAPGMYLTKVFYMRWIDGQVECLSMGSEIQQIKPEYFRDFGLDGGRPEDNAMVKNRSGSASGLRTKSQSEGKPMKLLV